MKDSEIAKSKKVIKILELLAQINVHKQAYIVEVLHTKYGLTYIEPEEEKQNELN